MQFISKESNDILVLLNPLRSDSRALLLGTVAGMSPPITLTDNVTSSLESTWDAKYRMELIATLKPLAALTPLNINRTCEVARKVWVDRNKYTVSMLYSAFLIGASKSLKGQDELPDWSWDALAATDRKNTSLVEYVKHTPKSFAEVRNLLHEVREEYDRTVSMDELQQFRHRYTASVKSFLDPAKRSQDSNMLAVYLDDIITTKVPSTKKVNPAVIELAGELIWN